MRDIFRDKRVQSPYGYMVFGSSFIIITIPRTHWLLCNLPKKLYCQSRKLTYIDQILCVRCCAKYIYNNIPMITQNVGIKYFVIYIKKLRLNLFKVTWLSDKARLSTQVCVTTKSSWSLKVSSTHKPLPFFSYIFDNLQHSFLLGMDKITSLSTGLQAANN